ncbi:PRC-barrel domain containing protein [Rhodobacteraceae bacterium CCMM004]|nr:PRC-barrel domain containing protein [Rhodobacteraceae bacterium CCMM004]
MAHLSLPALGLSLTVLAAPVLHAQEAAEGSKRMKATMLLGGEIYASAKAGATDMTAPLLEMPPDWENVGEIEDLSLTADGRIEGVVADIGGFLGIGETRVLVPLSDLRVVQVSGDTYFLTGMTQEQMEALQQVDEDFWQ